MFTRKTQQGASSAIWPYTPEASPRLAPAGLEVHIDEDFTMSEEEFKRSRPISLAAPREGSGTLSPGSRPTLQDVLNNTAPQPYTLSAFMAFLSQRHCLETLEFTLEAKKYHEKYDQAAATKAGKPLNHDSDEGFELEQDWVRLLDNYVKPGAPREINLPAVERDDLIKYPLGMTPPPPEALDPAVKRMYDLMSDSIFIPFCNNLNAVPHAQTYNALSDFGGRTRGSSTLDASRSTFDDRTGMHQRVPSRRRRSPPTTSPVFEKPNRPSSSTAHRHTQSSNLSSALSHAASNRLSTHASISSAASQAEDALTDDSGNGDNPAAGEPITPPTTPPMSDVPPSSSITSGVIHTSPPKANRSDSGNWKKMGRALWGKQRKSQGTLRERGNES